jgi:DeoR/GlpR family transcriptional regulator of sugar metabolism
MTETPAKRRKPRDIRGDARRAALLERLSVEADGTMAVPQIAAEFGVSLATVRRDLARLREAGAITRTYGGARADNVVPERGIPERQGVRAAEKRAIAQEAVRLIGDGDVVLLDAGTTTEWVARELPQGLHITAFTNGIGPTLALLDHDAAEIVLLGGRLRRFNQTICGAETEATVSLLDAAVSFVGADAINPAEGIASRSFEQARLKRLFMERSRRAVVVADSTKLEDTYYPYWSKPPRPWTLITDDHADPAALEALRQADPRVEIIIASSGSVLTGTGG